MKLHPVNDKGKKRGTVWRSGLMAVFRLRPPVCHRTLCCSGRFTAFRMSVSVRVQEAAGNIQLRACIHTWKLPSKTAVWSVGHSWVLNAWPRSCLRSPLLRLVPKPGDWTQNLLAVLFFSFLTKGLCVLEAGKRNNTVQWVCSSRRVTFARPLYVCSFFSWQLVHCVNGTIEKSRQRRCPL